MKREWTPVFFDTEDEAYIYISKRKADGKIVYLSTDHAAVYPAGTQWMIFVRDSDDK